MKLEDAVAVALKENPELKGKRAAISIAEGRLRQAGAWPNPVLEISAEDVPARSADISRGKRVIEMEQAVSLGGKVGWRKRAALLQLSLAEAEYQAAVREVSFHVQDRFVQVLAAQERKTLAEVEAALAREIATLAEALVQAGAVSPVELTKAEVEAAKSQGELEETEVHFQSVEAGLRKEMGAPALQVARYDGELADEIIWPDQEDLPGLFSAHPAMLAKSLKKEAAQAQAGLARAEAWPDVSLKAGAGRADGDRASIVQGMIAFPLPLFNRNQGSVQEAKAAIRLAEAEQESLYQQLRQEWEEATNRVGQAMKQVKRYRRDILPRAEKVLSAVQEGYREGKFRYIEVLEAQRSLAGARRVVLESVSTVNRGRWQIILLMGDTGVTVPPATLPKD
ncbi:MAG: TolC family protein [Elusimicrobiota bacterium]|nr:TolC family protein [Elusimicrobiota bacterium]